MKLVFVALAILGAVFCQGSPMITAMSATPASRSYVKQEIKMTFTGSAGSFGSKDKFGFVPVGSTCDTLTDGSAGTTANGLKAMTAPAADIATDGSWAKVTWTGADAPQVSTGSVLLALCYMDGDNYPAQGWRYYGTYKGMNYRVVAIASIDRAKFWTTLAPGPQVTITGSNLITGDFVGLAHINNAVNPCASLFATKEASITATAPGNTATVKFTLAGTIAVPDGLNGLNNVNMGTTYALCWRIATAATTASIDTMVTAQVAHMSARNAIHVAFPTHLHMTGTTGTIDTSLTPTLRLLGWNLQPNDKILLHGTTLCGMTYATSTVPASTPVGQGWLPTGVPSTQGDYSTMTYSLTGVVVGGGTTYASLNNIYVCYFAEGVAATTVLTTYGTASADGLRSTLVYLGDATANYVLKSYFFVTTYTNTDFYVLANDFANPGSAVTVFPLSLPGNYFVAGPTRTGFQFSQDTVTGCTGAVYPAATTTEAWPYFPGFSATATAGYLCYKNPGVGVTVVSSIMTSMTISASASNVFAVGGTGNVATPAPATTKGATWFMAGYKTPTSVLFAIAPTTIGFMDFILAKAAAGSDNQCATSQSRYTVFISDSALTSRVGSPSSLRPLFEGDASTAAVSPSVYNLGNTRATFSNGAAAGTTGDVDKEVEWRVCVRYRGNSASVSSWIATTLTVSQLPTITFATFGGTSLPVLTAGQSTADIYVFGFLSGDKIGFAGTTGISGQTDNSCDNVLPAGAVPITISAPTATATAGVATTKVTYTSATTAGGGGVSNAALCVSRTLKTPDARGILMTAVGGSTVTFTTSATTSGNINAYGGQSVPIALTAFVPVATVDGSSSAPGVVFKTGTCATGTAFANSGLSTFSLTPTFYTGRDGTNTGSAAVSTTAKFLLNTATTNPSVMCVASNTAASLASVRVASLSGSCTASTGETHVFAASPAGAGTYTAAGTGTGCTGSTVPTTIPSGKSFKLTGFGAYYPIGALTALSTASSYLLFDGLNLDPATDRIAFLPKATVAATGFTSPIAGVSFFGFAVGGSAVSSTYSIKNMETASKTGFYDNNVAGTSLSLDALAGGLYTAIFNANGADANANLRAGWVSTGKDFLVVKVTARFPQSVLTIDGTSNMYFTHVGLDTDTGDSFMSTTACGATTATLPTAANTNTGSVSLKPTFANGYGTVAVTLPSGTIAADTALAYWCYRPAGSATDAYFYNILGGAANTFTYILPGAAGTAIATAQLPILKAGTLSSGVFSILDGKTARVTLTLNSNSGTINDGYIIKVVNSADTDCTNAPTATTGNSASTLARPNRPTYDGSDFTLTATALTASNAATAAPTYKLCYSYRKTGTLVAADYALLAGTFAVKPIPSVSTSGNAAIVRNAKLGMVQQIDLTVAIGSATVGPRLNSDDTVCIVPKGSGAPVSGTAPYLTIYTAVGTRTVPATATAAAFTVYCVAAGLTTGASAGAQIADFSNVAGSVAGRIAMTLGEYDVYISAGAATATDIRGEPVKATGSVWVVEAKVRPSNVQLSAAAADTRTVYVNPEWVGNQIFIGTPCPADGTSGGAAATAAITQAFTSSGANKICVQSLKDTTTTGKRWIELDDVITVNTGALTTGLLPLPFTKVHARMPYQLNFEWSTHIAQAKDSFRTLKYNTGTLPTCGTHATSDVVGTDLTMVGQFSATQGNLYSVVGSATLVVPFQDYGTNGLQQVTGCWKQGSTNAAVFEDFPVTAPATSFKFKVVDVSSFTIGSADVLPGDLNLPRTLVTSFEDWVFFQGRWLDNDDFASFVPSMDTDCSRAWMYENAVIASGVAIDGDSASKYNYKANLDTGIALGGLYNLCYNAIRTPTGYRLYNDAKFPKLRVMDASITPSFATSGKFTTFTLKTYLDVALNANAAATTFDPKDRASFAEGGFSGTVATCASIVGTGTTPAALNANSFQANLTSTSGLKVYDPCIDYIMGSSYNVTTNIVPSGNMAATKYGGVVKYTDQSVQNVRVQVYATPRLIAVIPNTILLNQPTTLTFWGSSLSTSDAVNITTLKTDATDFCVNATTFSTPFTAPASTTPPTDNAVLLSNFVGPATGVWNVCYRPTGQALQKDTGVSITVVNIDGVTPTGVTYGVAAAGSQTVTLSGNFNFEGAADQHLVGLIPRDISGNTKNCALLNPANTVVGTRVATNNDKLVVTISSAMAPASIAEYSFCVHFANMPWADTSNPATDYVFINPVTVSFANRGITDFAPLSVVNGTTQTINFRGAGVRDFDKVLPIASTGVVADCDPTYKATPALATDVQNRQTTGTWALGTYKLCYGFNA